MFNRNQLKLFMMCLMVLDHLTPFVSNDVNSVLHVLTRCVAVFFAYMCVEGIHYSKDKIKYLQRLWLAGILMQIGNIILNYSIIAPQFSVHNNIFLTLALGTTILYLLQQFNKQSYLFNKIGILVVVVLLTCASILVEGGIVVIPFMIVCQLCAHRKLLRDSVLIAFSIFLFTINFVVYPTLKETLSMLAVNSDFMFITVLPFLALYNGEKGAGGPAMKSLFYIFYPAHLYIIAILATYLLK